MSTIKKISESEINSFIKILRNAYPGQAESEKDIKNAVEKFSKLQKDDNTKNFYGLYRDDKLLGGMLLHDFVMNFSSKKLRVGGLGSVAVDFLHKKEKVAKELVTYYLKHYRERKTYLAALYPFRHDFYKKMGFGFGTKMNQYKIKPCDFKKGDSKKNITYLDKGDKEDIINCYNRYFENNHGMMEKTDMEIKEFFKSENRIIGYKNNGKLEGYIVFKFHKDEGDSFLINDMYIVEFIYENNKALDELMTFLHSQNDQIRYIILNTQDEDFYHLMKNPVNGTNNIIPSVYHESNIQGVGLMYRIIDIIGLFKTLEKHNFNNQTCKLKLNIRDSFLKENNDNFIIHFENGKAKIKDTDDYEVKISLDIKEFSTMFMGVVNFNSLYRLGLADISNKSYLEKINKIFSISTKPICTTPF
ncbi:MAG: GNAT family N-acetyltransferase [Firmicutes bacterium]|nr:GNAT family N-acetyltransferase [Bacillota bacterium]